MNRAKLEAFLLGMVVTVRLAARASAEAIALRGLASADGEGSGWQWAPLRTVGRSVQMLTSDGSRMTWASVGLLADDCRLVSWHGLTFKSDGIVGLRQNVRERLAVVAMRHMGLSVDAPFSDAWNAETMELLDATLCEACGEPLYAAASIARRMGSECSGLEAGRRKRRETKRAFVQAMTPEEMARMIAERAKRK